MFALATSLPLPPYFSSHTNHGLPPLALQCKPDHVYSKFSWGNKRSLWDQPAAAGIDVPSRLQQYYKQQYSAERMALVVLGGQPLEELEEWVGELFGGVPGGLGPRPSFSGQGMPFQVSCAEAGQLGESKQGGRPVQKDAAMALPTAFQMNRGCTHTSCDAALDDKHSVAHQLHPAMLIDQ